MGNRVLRPVVVFVLVVLPALDGRARAQKAPDTQGPVVVAAQPSPGSVAISNGPLRYRWQWDRKLLAGQTSSTLTLVSVQPTEAGAYQALVSHQTPLRPCRDGQPPRGNDDQMTSLRGQF